MRWSYKTHFFELKKDGLLGGSFLDESEIEEVLNSYGRHGWELVSMLDTRDGVSAVFKQPVGPPSSIADDHELPVMAGAAAASGGVPQGDNPAAGFYEGEEDYTQPPPEDYPDDLVEDEYKTVGDVDDDDDFDSDYPEEAAHQEQEPDDTDNGWQSYEDDEPFRDETGEVREDDEPEESEEDDSEGIGSIRIE